MGSESNGSFQSEDALKSLDAWKELLIDKMKFEMVSEYGLPESATLTFETAPGRRVSKLVVSNKGLYLTFCIKKDHISYTAQTVNDSNVRYQEEDITGQINTAVLSFFDKNKDLYPE